MLLLLSIASGSPISMCCIKYCLCFMRAGSGVSGTGGGPYRAQPLAGSLRDSSGRGQERKGGENILFTRKQLIFKSYIDRLFKEQNGQNIELLFLM